MAHRDPKRLAAVQPRSRLGLYYLSVGSLVFVRATGTNQSAQARGRTILPPLTLCCMAYGPSRVDENTAMYLRS